MGWQESDLEEESEGGTGRMEYSDEPEGEHGEADEQERDEGEEAKVCCLIVGAKCRILTLGKSSQGKQFRIAAPERSLPGGLFSVWLLGQYR